MLEPTYFENNLQNFPITWDDVETPTWDDLKANPEAMDTVFYDKRLGYNVTTSYLTHISTEIHTDMMDNYERILANLVALWQQIRLEGYGMENNVYVSWFFWDIFDQ